MSGNRDVTLKGVAHGRRDLGHGRGHVRYATGHLVHAARDLVQRRGQVLVQRRGHLRQAAGNLSYLRYLRHLAQFVGRCVLARRGQGQTWNRVGNASSVLPQARSSVAEPYLERGLGWVNNCLYEN